MSVPIIADAAERARALDPQRSLIVQAPAGAGKTELLAQRYLRLLSRVEAPEEILAITFTRKAATEMRERVLNALRTAAVRPPAERAEADLAQMALEHAARLDWDLLGHPARLRIMTIDSLCHSIARQMPLLARTVAALRINPNPAELYREAAHRMLASLGGEGSSADAVERLIRHLDNRLPLAERLLTSMLERRDHWLPLVLPGTGSAPSRSRLEAALERLVADDLTALGRRLSATQVEELLALARAAAQALQAEGRQSTILACRGVERLALAGPQAIAIWRGLADLLLTADGRWRRSADRRIGLLPHAVELKRRHAGLIAALAADAGLRPALHAVRRLPAPRYADAQWEMLEGLLEVLPLAAAELELLFSETGQVDFVSVATAALAALGRPDAPSEQALALDYRIQHLLVDEFQDTSIGQYRLLEALTAGWHAGDGRTLFLVGDPMQSIYRFREAEVALFLRAAREGIGSVALEPVTLQVNFRSHRRLVEWFNETFAPLFPADDPARGAISYAASLPYRPAVSSPAVTLHRLASPEAETERIAELADRALEEEDCGSLAVLVASRRHLLGVFEALRSRGIQFQAVEIEPLADRPIAHDLLALTRALAHRGDRSAWLSVLRAPWCGLSLADLHTLAAGARQATVWMLLGDAERIGRLSEDGRRRLQRCLPVLAASLAEEGRRRLRPRVESAWRALGGPACLGASADLLDARSYLDLLEEIERGGTLPDAAVLQRRLQGLFAASDPQAEGRVQLMTIHRAKGLQFDTVILPGLGRRIGQEEARLLRWLEVVRPGRDNDLVLAPLAAYGETTDPLQRYLQSREGQRNRYERLRLLYVAATRARRRLHLTAALEGDVATPPRESPLALLWPTLGAQFAALPIDAEPPAGRASRIERDVIERLPWSWQLPAPVPSVSGRLAGVDAEPDGEHRIRFDWAGEIARHVGTVVHRELLELSGAALPEYSADWTRRRNARYRRRLEELGVPERFLVPAIQRVGEAVAAAIDDPRGRWLLGSRHRLACSEWALSGWIGGRLHHVVVDRSFVDESGVRWIVDYKTSRHEGGDPEGFLANEQQRYRPQLELYAALISALEPERPLRLGLYFPLLRGWREWQLGD